MTTLTYKIPEEDIRRLARLSTGGIKVMLWTFIATIVVAAFKYLYPSWVPFSYIYCFYPLIIIFITRESVIRAARTDPQFNSERKVEYDDRYLRCNIPTGTWCLKWTEIEYMGKINDYYHLKTGYSRAPHLFIPISSFSDKEHTEFQDLLTKNLSIKL